MSNGNLNGGWYFSVGETRKSELITLQHPYSLVRCNRLALCRIHNSASLRTVHNNWSMENRTVYLARTRK